MNRGKAGCSEIDECDFGERCNLVTEGKIFVKDKAKSSSRVGGIK